jgi:hypothetical protein
MRAMVFEEANPALKKFRGGKLDGTAVLVISSS